MVTMTHLFFVERLPVRRRVLEKVICVLHVATPRVTSSAPSTILEPSYMELELVVSPPIGVQSNIQSPAVEVRMLATILDEESELSKDWGYL